MVVALALDFLALGEEVEGSVSLLDVGLEEDLGREEEAFCRLDAGVEPVDLLF